MARNHWVGFERFDALPDRELKPLLRNAYQMVLEKLPKRVQAQLESAGATAGKKQKRR
jgi:predicted DNA-binding protein (MmcQ/YjbR family)